MKKQWKTNSFSSSVWQKLCDIKEAVKHFDIKPAKPMLAQKLLEAEQSFEQKNYTHVIKILQDLLTSHRSNLQVLKLLIKAHVELNHFQDSIRLLKYAVRLYPDDWELHYTLSCLYRKLKELRMCAKHILRALELQPQDATLQHLAASVQRNTTTRPPAEYIQNLFDKYAVNFENSLVNNLSYTAHIQLVNHLKAYCTASSVVLDLGCGTGLLGHELKQHFTINNLIGVDLSPNMLNICGQKKLYNSLQEQDLVDFLQQQQLTADLIVSSDSLIYLGDLDQVFAHSHRILASGGLFSFTIEKSLFGSYKLQQNGRYKHSLKYLKSLYKRYHFSKMYTQTIDLRKEYGNMVAGYLVLIQK